MRIKAIYKIIVPRLLRSYLSLSFYNFFILFSPIRNYFQLHRLKKKQEIHVLLFMYNIDSWKLHSVYSALSLHKRFKPTIVICPIITKGESFLMEKIQGSIDYCKNNKCNYFVAYDYESSNVINVKKVLSCDIVFFTNPNQLSGEELYIDNFDDCLTCYVPYSFRIDKLYEYEYNNRTVNKVWKCFYETNIHKQLAETYADNNGRNVVVSGFPYLDVYMKHEVPDKIDHRKLIIWAPHWTIKGAQNTGLDWACFLDYSDFVLELAEKYEEQVCFVMKPHPFLFDTLKQENVWGEERTQNYIRRWELSNNCSIETGDYVSLFIKSDALIHDSGSFMAEYMVQNKPIAYTANSEFERFEFNSVGQRLLEHHQIVYSATDFEAFILDVIHSDDKFQDKRHVFLSEMFIGDSDRYADRILSVIENEIFFLK